MFKLFKRQSSGESLLKELQKYNYLEAPDRKNNLNRIANKGKDLKEPLAYLSTAFAYCFLGAKTRKEAIKYFELYMSNPIQVPQGSFYNYQNTFVNMAKLYEAEYQFDLAEKYYILYEKESAKKNVIKNPNIPLGNLYVKISTKRALEYWENIMNTSDYLNDKEYKRLVDIAYREVKEKHKKGYVYKPRKQKEHSVL